MQRIRYLKFVSFVVLYFLHVFTALRYRSIMSIVSGLGKKAVCEYGNIPRACSADWLEQGVNIIGRHLLCTWH